MSKPNVVIKTLTGTGQEVIVVSSQYRRYQITLVGITTGKVTIESKSVGNTVFSKLINGQMSVEFDTTLLVFGQTEAFRFTYPTEEAYTVKIKQTDADTER